MLKGDERVCVCVKGGEGRCGGCKGRLREGVGSIGGYGVDQRGKVLMLLLLLVYLRP